MSILRYATGRGRFVGQSLIYPVPIPLDAAQYFGAAVVGEDGQFYYSNGLEWIVPIEDNEILRPSALVPFSVDERTQLRLTTFRSPAGLEQTGIIFEISTNGADFDGALTRIVPGFGNAYQIAFPEDGFGPGDRVLWRAAYTGTGGTQSNFSVPYAQTFPELISRPAPITRENAITGTVRVTDFESAAIFGYGYAETQTEFYAPDATPGVSAPLISVTHTGGAITTVPIPPLEPAQSYLWRARYGGRLNAAAPVIYSDWSSPRSFFLGAASLILVYDLTLASARTIFIPLGGGTVNNPLDVTIDWGDGTSERFTTAGIKPHLYAEGAGPRITVTITGRLDWYGTSQPIDQAGLVRVENIGFAIGLTSLRGAFRQTTTALDYITPNIPETVTSFEELFFESSCAADLRGMDTRNITTIRRIFYRSDGTGPNCANWDVGRVTDVFQAFADSQMNNPFSLGNWESLTSMEQMFVQTQGNYSGGRDGRVLFNQPIASWDVSRITSMRLMFGCTAAANVGGIGAAFNQPINAWDVRAVQSFEGFMGHLGDPGITSGGAVFNQPLNLWNTSAADTMRRMFAIAPAFNQDIGNWNIESVTDLSAMFASVIGSSARIYHSFNRSIERWNTARVSDMSFMFLNGSFDQPLATWQTGAAKTMRGMFQSCPFNQPIGTWDVSAVSDMAFMFANVLTNTSRVAFDQDIGAWDVGRVTTMEAMFAAVGAGSSQFHSFNNGGNASISAWDVSQVTSMRAMFACGIGGSGLRTHPFNQPIGSWNVERVADMSRMFAGNNHAFDQDIGNWPLRPTGLALTDFMASSIGRAFSEANYSRLLTGWANRVATMSDPVNTAVLFEARRYNTTAYQPGARFTSAPPARTFLTTPRSLSVAGADVPETDGIYTFDAAASLYLKSDGWYFLKIGPDWTLFDPADSAQATGTGMHPWDVTPWSGALITSTILINGAAWTIAGDSAA
ncbi:MAG: BspA family leucine-rich repeat surface protein [Roseovarius sp.]